jgi:hypothetical protein
MLMLQTLCHVCKTLCLRRITRKADVVTLFAGVHAPFEGITPLPARDISKVVTALPQTISMEIFMTTANASGDHSLMVKLVEAQRDAYKWAYTYLQDRMRSIGRFGWAQDCDGEIEFRSSKPVANIASSSSASFKTTLFVALKSAGTVIVNGYEIDTQIDGDKVGKPDQVMLACCDDYTVFFTDQEIEIDVSGTAMVACKGDGPETPKAAVTFMVTVPLQRTFLLKSEGVEA